MNVLIFLCCIGFVALTVATPVQNKPHYDLNDAEVLFEKFQSDYHKNYKDATERQLRFENFKLSLEAINQLNSDPAQENAVFDINELSDLSQEEIKERFMLQTANL
ncbi:hypothetical protein O0L34_g6479 [Tuta absoluta]|nr:hypothetical protein O0L34_g6479 [Tuta absoluta]